VKSSITWPDFTALTLKSGAGLPTSTAIHGLLWR
jgi:hypothetical protein